MLENPVVAFIGGGNIARAMIKGLFKNYYPTDRMIVSSRGQEKLDQLIQEFKICKASSNAEAARKADIIFLTVGSGVVKNICQDIKEVIKGSNKLVISLATATPTSDISYWLNTTEKVPIIRVVTNIIIGVRSGSTILFANTAVSELQKKMARNIFAQVGSVMWVNEESELKTYTSLVACGPASVFLLIEALQKAAIEQGVPEPIACQLALKVVCGASEVAKISTLNMEQLRQNVTPSNSVTEHSLKPIAANYLNLFHQSFEAAEKHYNEIEASLNHEANRAKL